LLPAKFSKLNYEKIENVKEQKTNVGLVDNGGKKKTIFSML
jgi:hypothetical protein